MNRWSASATLLATCEPEGASSSSCGCPSCDASLRGRPWPGSISPTHLVFDEFELATQGCTSHHYRHDPDGTVRYGSGRFRYAWPAELDLMARIAGMRLENRYAGWSCEPFGSESTSHVSVWRKD